MLENRMDLIDLSILDLCAGTGNISFELISREAGYVTAVDNNFNCVRHIRQLAKSFEVDDVLHAVKADAVKFLESTGETYDLIFSDPPYEASFYREMVQTVFERNLLKEDGVLIIEHGKRTDLSELPHYQQSRGYGNVVFSFFNLAS